ncbi:MAG TPA: hypothetical protein VJQ82_17225 [Terriglobales bacterium]|nr:hypothetical protein [Terriglobales bacterium]
MAEQDLDAMPDSSAGANDSDGGIANGISWESAAAETLPGGNADLQSVSDSQGAEDGTGAGNDKEPPFHTHPRWKEQQAKLKELEDKLAAATSDSEAVKADRRLAEYIRQQGFDSPEALEAAAAKSKMEEELKEFEAREAAKLRAAIERQEITQEEAQARLNSEMKREREAADLRRTRTQMEAQMNRMNAQFVDGLIEAASISFPDADMEAIRERALAQSSKPGFDAREFIKAAAKKSHDAFQTKLEQRMANDEHAKAKAGKAPPSNDKSASGGQNAAASKFGVPNPAAFAKRVVSANWSDLLGVKIK